MSSKNECKNHETHNNTCDISCVTSYSVICNFLRSCNLKEWFGLICSIMTHQNVVNASQKNYILSYLELENQLYVFLWITQYVPTVAYMISGKSMQDLCAVLSRMYRLSTGCCCCCCCGGMRATGGGLYRDAVQTKYKKLSKMPHLLITFNVILTSISKLQKVNE
jgi:hypothetical protein